MRISIAMCTYNGAAHVEQQLHSFSEQTRRPDEVVICDDRSSDDTIHRIEQFSRDAPFLVRLHRNDETLGSTKNFERAVSMCSGDIIALSDQDDVWLPKKIEAIEAVFAEHPATGMVASDALLVDAKLHSLGVRLWATLPFGASLQRRFVGGSGAQLLLCQNYITGATMAFRASLRDRLLPFPSCWVHDGWIACVSAALAECRLLPEPLILYRQHANQQIGAVRLSLRRQIQNALRFDEAYFMRQAECFKALLTRFLLIRPELSQPQLIELVQEKIHHCLERAQMRRSSRFMRFFAVFREIARRRYAWFGQGFLGWKTIAADLFL